MPRASAEPLRKRVSPQPATKDSPELAIASVEVVQRHGDRLKGEAQGGDLSWPETCKTGRANL